MTSHFRNIQYNLAILPGNLPSGLELRSLVAQTSAEPLQGERIMLWTIFVILVILWLLGFSFHIGGGLIHILLVIAVIVLVYNLLTGRRGL